MWTCWVMRVMSTDMLTANMLLSVFFLTGALADCRDYSALFITTPKKMEALSGSCLQIPCSFNTGNDPRKPTFDSRTVGVWIKDNTNFRKHPENVIFKSDRTQNTYPMKITGDLSDKNCTTVFSSLITTYTNTYYFRIETPPFMATADCDPLYITVRDSPPKPRMEISGEQKEKESVTITCSAVTPCPHSPPTLTWNLQDGKNYMEENSDGTFTTKIQKIISLTDRNDGDIITCSANYSVNEGKDAKTAEENVTLSVSYAPKDTSARISPSDPVSPGSWVNLTCSSRAKPDVSFTWFKISKDGPMNVSEGDFYSFNVTDGGVYYCVAANDLGNQTSSKINLILKGSENVGGSDQLKLILGGIAGAIGLICLFIFVSFLLFKLRRPTPKQAESQANLAAGAAAENNEIHYGEIDFSKQKLDTSSNSVQDVKEQQHTVYAQVNVSKPKNSLTPDDEPEVLYAEVKKD